MTSSMTSSLWKYFFLHNLGWSFHCWCQIEAVFYIWTFSKWPQCWGCEEFFHLKWYNFRDKCRLHQPQFHTYTYGFKSFKYSGSKLWNSLPRAIKNTNDINEFKKNITEWCQTCDLSKLDIFWCPFLFQIQAITMYPFVTFTGVVY